MEKDYLRKCVYENFRFCCVGFWIWALSKCWRIWLFGFDQNEVGWNKKFKMEHNLSINLRCGLRKFLDLGPG